MNEIQYLSVEDVVAIHDDIVDRMGGAYAPLLDSGKLESALSRCRNAAWYGDADLVLQAAILAVSISQSQSFLDGNKRAGFAVADVFLRINGLVFSGDQLEMARMIEHIAEVLDEITREAETALLAEWLRQNSISDDTSE